MAERRKRKPSNNVFTVLLAAAFVVLLLGVVYLWMRYSEVTGQVNPFAFQLGPTLDLARAALPV